MLFYCYLLGVTEKSLKAGVIKKAHNSLLYITVKTIILVHLRNLNWDY
jgi:hypothetical protein